MKLWNRLLIFLHLRRDWANELDFTPPAFDSVPHDYDCLRDDGQPLECCAKCGGGRRHAIHNTAGYCHHPAWMRCPACDPKRKLDPMPGPWGKVHARSLEEEQRRTDNGER